MSDFEIVVPTVVRRVEEHEGCVQVFAGEMEFLAPKEMAQQFYVGRDVEVALRFPKET